MGTVVQGCKVWRRTVSVPELPGGGSSPDPRLSSKSHGEFGGHRAYSDHAHSVGRLAAPAGPPHSLGGHASAIRAVSLSTPWPCRRAAPSTSISRLARFLEDTRRGVGQRGRLGACGRKPQDHDDPGLPVATRRITTAAMTVAYY